MTLNKQQLLILSYLSTCYQLLSSFIVH